MIKQGLRNSKPLLLKQSAPNPSADGELITIVYFVSLYFYSLIRKLDAIDF